MAKRFKISVMDTTPVSRPDSRAPGKPLGMTVVVKVWLGSGDGGVGALAGDGGITTLPDGEGLSTPAVGASGGPAGWLGWRSGVAGALGDGEADSTTHMRWDLVATSLATVWPRVEYGLTWNTGNESRPCSMPRSERITLMKFMHELLRSGRLAAFVRSLTSTADMFPTTFRP